MKILPIINDTRRCVAKNINKSILVAPMLLAISSPEILAKDTFSKMDSSNIIQTTNFGVDSGSESVYDFSPELNLEKEASKVYSSERVQKKVFKLETRQNKYREKLREKESEYKYYNNILRAINGDKKAKKEVLKHVEEHSTKRDLAIFASTGVAGVALSAVTGPAGLLLCMVSFFTSNHINNYVVEKKTSPKQKQDVISEIKKLEKDMSEIKEKISSIQFKISELE